MFYKPGKTLIVAEEEIKQSDVISFMPCCYIINILERINKFMNKINNIDDTTLTVRDTVEIQHNHPGVNRPLNPKSKSYIA